MALLTDLLFGLSSVPIKEVAIGKHQTAVLSERLGLCTTQRDEGSTDVPDLVGEDASRVAEYLADDSLLKATIGMAAFQSVQSVDPSARNLIDGNARDYVIEKGSGKRVAVIGHFPFVDRYRERFKNLDVFEKKLRPGDLPVSAMEERLPNAELVVLTGMTLVNHSFSGIRRLISENAYVVMMGPSVPLSPVLFDYGVDLLGGTLVLEPLSVLSQCRQALSFRQMSGIRKCCLLKDR